MTRGGEFVELPASVYGLFSHPYGLMTPGGGVISLVTKPNVGVPRMVEARPNVAGWFPVRLDSRSAERQSARPTAWRSGAPQDKS